MKKFAQPVRPALLHLPTSRAPRDRSSGTAEHTCSKVIVESYHLAIATPWSSAWREWSEKSIGQRLRLISIMDNLQSEPVLPIG